MANPMYGQNKADDKIDALVDSKYLYKFDHYPQISSGNAVQKLLDGTEDDAYIHSYQNGLVLYGYYVGTNTVDAPVVSTEGVEYSFTDTDDIGNQWMLCLPGSIGREGQDVFTVGNAAFYARLKLKVSDADGTDDLHFGFKLASDTVETTGVAYTDFVSINLDGGNVKMESNINNDGATSGDSGTDISDEDVMNLEVKVSQAGLASFYHNGSQLTTNDPSASMDIGDIVTPWFFFRNDSNKTDVILKELEVGLQ